MMQIGRARKSDAKQSRQETFVANYEEETMIKIMQFILPLFLLVALSAPAAKSQEVEEICTDAITINGICWQMSLPQMMQGLEQRNFSCRSLGLDGFLCSGNSSMVLGLEKQVFFSCEQFNACDIGFADLARAVAEQSPVAELRYENTPFGGKYCGMGSMGDIVCVFASNDIVSQYHDIVRPYNTSFRDFFKKNIIMIKKGAIASGGIRLN